MAKIKFIPMRQQSQQRNSFFSSRFESNLMLPACLLGMILVETKFATEIKLEISLCYTDLQKSDKKECLIEASAA